ncbi:MAG: hypothetical protein ACREBS_05740 [Nitrososphaerales archaeon]
MELRSLKNALLSFRRAPLWKKLIVCLVLIGFLLTVILPGTVPHETIHILNGQQYLVQTYAEATSVSAVNYFDRQSNWTLGSTSLPAASVQVGSSSITTLSGSFKPDSRASSVMISRQLSVNLMQHPILFVAIQVTQGIGYGIKFFSTAGNKTLSLWSNGDVLDHRKGTGQIENIQINVQLLSKLNTGSTAQNITKMQIYVERAASPSNTPFSLAIQQLEFLNYSMVTSPQSGGSYHSMYFTFSDFPINASSWVLNKIDLELKVSASAGASYEIYQFNGTSTLTGTVYHYSPDTSTYQYSLYPKGSLTVLPDTLPRPGNYSLVVVALGGVLSNVQLQSVSFVYSPVQNSSSMVASTAGESWWYFYLVLFLFAIPVGTALAIYNHYRKRGEFKVWHVIVAIALGLGCRIALAPVGNQPFDLSIYATSARGWFEYATPSTSFGPTLPFTFFLYWIPYSFYGLLLKLGFHDFFILNHQVGFFESIFLKGFPIAADLFVCYLILRFDSGARGKVLALFYFLNPLAIYISSVWGQYEAGTISFVILGFLFMSREDVGIRQEFKVTLAFAISALTEIVGLITFVFLLAKALVSRQIVRALILASPLALLLVYPPEWHVIYLIFSGSIGQSSALLFSNPHTPYTIFSNFSGVSSYHPLIVLLLIVGIAYIIRRKFDLENTIAFTFLSFVIFLLFAGQEPQWWLFLVPLGLIYAIVSGKFAFGPYMFVFGTMIAFLILTFTQGSGYILFGNPRLDLVPAIEGARHGIDVYTVTTAIGALVAVGYLIFGERITSHLPIIRSGSLILFGTVVLSFLMFTIMGANV